MTVRMSKEVGFPPPAPPGDVSARGAPALSAVWVIIREDAAHGPAPPIVASIRFERPTRGLDSL